MASIPIDFITFRNNHPHFTEISSKVEPQVAVWQPPCCIQISYALNNSGAPIVKGDFNSPEMGRKVRYVKDSKNNFFVLDVFDTAAYLNERYGLAERFSGNKTQMISKINGRNGIIRFGTLHIDVWEKDHFHQQGGKGLPDKAMENKTAVQVWDNASLKTHGIYFWEITGSAARTDVEPLKNFPTPTWLQGWWVVEWRNTLYYYLFEPNGKVTWSKLQPGSDHRNMPNPGDRGTCQCMGSQVLVRWNKTGSVENYSKFFDNELIGSWNQRESIKGMKLWQ